MEKRSAPAPRNAAFIALLLAVALCGCLKTGPGTPASQPEALTTDVPAGPEAKTPPSHILDDARQLVLVISPNWSSFNAVMTRFERDAPGSPWRQAGEPRDVVIGKNGMAWGRGLHGVAAGPGPVKREGDKKSPAGAFSLGTAFAYEPKDLPFTPAMPVKTVGEETICVENPDSRYYNVILDSNGVSDPDWKDPDMMRRPDGLYRYGFFMNHNFPRPEPGAGSCIFFHLWRGPNQYTVGCTAMTRENMLELLGWLDAAKNPAVVQLPRREALEFAKAWGAPALTGQSLR